MNRGKRQRGAFMVFAAVVIIMLVGITALAIDIGRVTSLRAEMQNAADAASLAAAAELDTGTNARARAVAAAQNLLVHDSRFAEVAALLGPTPLPYNSSTGAGAFTFYCVVGSDNDPTSSIASTYCSSSKDASGNYLATTDANAHYVTIKLDPGVGGGYFSLKLLLLPVLGAAGAKAPTGVAMQASSMGGRSFYTCAVAPIGICDPWEGSGSNFHQNMVPGQSIELDAKGNSGQWSAGNFGFLEAPNGGPGAKDVSAFLANESNAGCSSPTITTQPGAMTQKVVDAINTRFDQYGKAGGFNATSDPPAPDIEGYPEDATSQSINYRFGNGDWNFNSYWASAHGGTAPNAWSNVNRPSRWTVYNYEISQNKIPAAGVPTHTAGSLSRRLIDIAVMSCNAMGLGGRSSGTIFPPDGYAQVFLYRQADPPSATAIWAEYVGWVSVGGGGSYHVDTQLYK